MKKFVYTAKDREGRKISGEVEASDARIAARLIRERDLVVIKIKSSRENLFSFAKRFRTRVTRADIATFTRQLSTMINAGMPITEALSILQNQSKASLESIVSQLLADVEGGRSLSEAMSKYPKIFTPTYIALIKSGEAGGVLDRVLARLADNLEKEQEFKGKVKGALIYPAIIIIGMFVVGVIMMVFVVPRLTALYAEFEADLPLPTKILIGISTLMVKTWYLFLGFLGVLLWALTQYRATKLGRRKTDELIFKIPLFGDLLKQMTLTELTRTLSLMVGAGVSILEGLRITAGVVGNVVIADALKDAAVQIEKGFPIAYSFAKHPEAFPYILSQMISVGEETGKMEEVLLKLSRIFEVESDQKVKALTSAVEPLIMVVLGLGVGFLVVAVILPIYNLTSQF